jgi:Ca2+-binding EF-hand superfamily protein
VKSPARTKTTEIVEKLKFERFKFLFHRLDSDGDGLISAERIDISTVSAELLEIMTPLFCELEELGKTNTNEEQGDTLDLDEFVDALNRLYEQVSHPEKHIIMQECGGGNVSARSPGR